MPRNRELDDAAELLRGLHHHVSWLCKKVNMRRRVQLMKKMRNERKLKKLRMLYIKYMLKHIKKQMKQLIKQVKKQKKKLDEQAFENKIQGDEQAFENWIQDECRKSALTAPSWVSANKKAQARSLASL